MISAKNRGIFYSTTALTLMGCAIIATFFSFESGFLRTSLDRTAFFGSMLLNRALVLLTFSMLVVGVALLLNKGLTMWRADSWKTERRTISGVELKLEAAVLIGLGFTVVFIVARGLLN